MKRLLKYVDAFIIGGFVTNFFSGFLNPLYITLILSHLDLRVIAAGSFISSACPLVVGVMLGKRKIFDRLYTILPVVMVAELVTAALSVCAVSVDLGAYYLLTMLIFGIFTTSVVYLLQKLKEVRYRRNRASFDRRCMMADAFGYLAGSVLSFMDVVQLRDPLAIAVLGVLQTVIVYGLFILLYRKVPVRRRRHAEEEPHPRPFRAALYAYDALAA